MMRLGQKYRHFQHNSGCACHSVGLAQLSDRVSLDLSRRGFIAGMTTSIAALGLPGFASAQTSSPSPKPTLFTNLRLFDGTGTALRGNVQILVAGNRIAAVDTGNNPAPPDANVIDCGGRVLMPGLIDAHWHSMFAALPLNILLGADAGAIHLAASAEAERTLLRGFTTVRDLGGPAFAFKQAIDEGIVAGPRIYPCGAMITATGGHGDLRPLTELPRLPGGRLSLAESSGGAAIADSPDEVRLRVREQLMQGASQIKLVAGGGVSSPRAPLDMTTFSEPELRAGVEAAADRGTYVAVHAYAPQAIQRSISAGAQCIEHAHLMDEATAKIIADTGTWLSIQPFLSDADTGVLTGPSRVASLQVFAGTDNAYKLAIKHKLKTAFGSDMLFSAAHAARQGIMLSHLDRWYAAPDILKMATSGNAELLNLSGARNPYPGALGVIAKDAYADLLVVDGDPTADIAVMADPAKNLRLVMKDGTVHKNTL